MSRVVTEKDLRRAIVETAQTMSARGLSPGRSGNVSARFERGMLITPTALSYDVMRPKDIVYVSDKGETRADERKPSSEWQFHLAAYHARPDRHAIVHTHSMYATVLACAHKPIPAFHYMVAVAGGKDIPCVPYATFGTEQLATFVADGVRNRDACLMANHGQIAIGTTLGRALHLAFEIETLAEQYCKVLLLNALHILPDDEMAVMVEKFKAYGRNADDE